MDDDENRVDVALKLTTIRDTDSVITLNADDAILCSDEENSDTDDDRDSRVIELLIRKDLREKADESNSND